MVDYCDPRLKERELRASVRDIPRYTACAEDAARRAITFSLTDAAAADSQMLRLESTQDGITRSSRREALEPEE